LDIKLSIFEENGFSGVPTSTAAGSATLQLRTLPTDPAYDVINHSYSLMNMDLARTLVDHQSSNEWAI
jgi:hypothetical protein